MTLFHRLVDNQIELWDAAVETFGDAFFVPIGVLLQVLLLLGRSL